MDHSQKTFSPASSSETNELEALIESYKASMELQRLKEEDLRYLLHFTHHTLEMQRKTLSWKITFPLRVVRSLSKGYLPTGHKIPDVWSQVKEVYSEDGAQGVWLKLQPHIRKYLDSKTSERSEKKKDNEVKKIIEETIPPVERKNSPEFRPVFLIVAELSLRQCAKYRVWQKKEELESIGWKVVVIDWRKTQQVLSALSTCTHVIFYRTPAFDSVKSFFSVVRKLSLPHWWEVDDLIFSEEHYKNNKNLDRLPPKERKEVLSGGKLFLECLQACDRAIASTRTLAKLMKEAGVKEVSIIENALDKQTLEAASLIRTEQSGVEKKSRKNDEVRIVYGSGTKTHDVDFSVAAAGIVAAMQADPRLTLHIMGDLTVPPECDVVKDRIFKHEGRDYVAYMRFLANADITIAPLEDSVFNDCKSNIKFLEAAILEVPSVCSPSDTFVQVVRHGQNGLLAKSKEEWSEALLSLASDPTLREKIGKAARCDVLEQYDPAAIVKNQVIPVIGYPPVPSKTKLSVMAVNVYFAPRSFGGATIVAEQMAKYLQARDFTVNVFTSRPDYSDGGNQSVRYEIDGFQVLSVPVPGDDEKVAGLDNPLATEAFSRWLSFTKPDVVHFHSIQRLGVGLTRACLEAGIPYVITLHDAWWLCDRQFMVTPKGHFCFQDKIDLQVCTTCEFRASHLESREILMRNILENAALLLTPSEIHKQLFVENGLSAEKIVVNLNGFTWPQKPKTPREKGAPLRFGYVGGVEAIKGYKLIREVFESLESSSWELKIVDNKLNIGIQSVYTDGWKVKGKVESVPAYNQSNMDDFFDGIDVLLFPSQWKESYGLTVREALARDVWVIATAPGGQAEVIVEGQNGNLIPIGAETIFLEKAVTDLLATPEKFDNYTNPFKDSLPTFEQQANQLEELLRNVIAEKKKPLLLP